jgi:hypothetical protein
MLFSHGVFSPEFITDPRVQPTLHAAVLGAEDVIRPSHILAAALQHGGDTVARTLTQALQAGRSLGELQESLPCLDGAAGGPTTVGREAFAPHTVWALEEFDAIFQGSGGVLAETALELLLFCTLTHLDEADRRAAAALDAEKAARLFRDLVTRAMGPHPGHAPPAPEQPAGAPGSEDEQPTLLPPRLAYSEDLTYQIRRAPPLELFPFDDEPVFEALFDAITRALHRRQGNHVLLTGERGVGKNTILAELARRAAAGRIPFLASSRFLRVDCRYVPPTRAASDWSPSSLTSPTAPISWSVSTASPRCCAASEPKKTWRFSWPAPPTRAAA